MIIVTHSYVFVNSGPLKCRERGIVRGLKGGVSRIQGLGVGGRYRERRKCEPIGGLGLENRKLGEFAKGRAGEGR